MGNRSSRLCCFSWPEVAYEQGPLVVDMVHSQVSHEGGREQIPNGKPFHAGSYPPIHGKPVYQSCYKFIKRKIYSCKR